MKTKCYSELIQIPSFEERFKYLQLHGVVAEETFGASRYLNQDFYRSKEWRSIRNQVILRDHGCDLAMDGYEIFDRACVHHIIPVDPNALAAGDYSLAMSLDNLVCVSYQTHNAIHFGDEALLPKVPIERKPGDTCLWR